MNETLSIVCAASDVLILVWLIGTWFYEGHHKKCAVTVTCEVCGHTAEHKCSADPRNNE